METGAGEANYLQRKNLMIKNTILNKYFIKTRLLGGRNEENSNK